MKLVMKGNLAFASQTPFILNSTVRDNILFGNEYDKELYDSVIEACNLLPDLKQLGLSGDLTEIGERGLPILPAARPSATSAAGQQVVFLRGTSLGDRSRKNRRRFSHKFLLSNS